MTKETFEKAKELTENISVCESILELPGGFQHYYTTGLCSQHRITMNIPDNLTSDIKALIKKKLEEYKQELEAL